MLKQTIWQRSSFFLLCIVLAISHVACGSNPTNQSLKTVRPSLKSQSFNPLGDLLAQAQTALKATEDPHPKAKSSVRFVILHTQALPDDEQTLTQLTKEHFKITTKVLKSYSVNSLVTSKLADRYTVTTTKNTDSLPIRLEVLSSSLTRLKSELSDYQGLTFVTYKGQALHSGLQIKSSCQIAQKLSESPLFSGQSQLIIGSLSTFEVFDLAEFSEKCKDDEYPWVRLSAELSNQKVRLVTRGLNQWGRPEVELGPIEKSQVSTRFPQLVQVVESLRTHPMLTEDQPLPNLTFGPCLRPEHHYDGSCRRLLFE